MKLHRRFMTDVGNGRDITKMLVATNTGTGFNLTTGNKVGMCCLDRSSAKWFLCTATTGTGTWVGIN